MLDFVSMAKIIGFNHKIQWHLRQRRQKYMFGCKEVYFDKIVSHTKNKGSATIHMDKRNRESTHGLLQPPGLASLVNDLNMIEHGISGTVGCVGAHEGFEDRPTGR